LLLLLLLLLQQLSKAPLKLRRTNRGERDSLHHEHATTSKEEINSAEVQ
jgi:hypothetical protein